MDFETIQLEILDRKAVLTLNRPNSMNAMNYTMMRELADCFESLHNERTYTCLSLKVKEKYFQLVGILK